MIPCPGNVDTCVCGQPATEIARGTFVVCVTCERRKAALSVAYQIDLTSRVCAVGDAFVGDDVDAYEAALRVDPVVRAYLERTKPSRALLADQLDWHRRMSPAARKGRA